MTVQTNNNSISYVGNGSTAHFDYDYLILDASHLKVYFGDVLQTSGYVVSGVSSQTGGTVAFAVAPPNGTNITLIRDVPFLQLTDYQPYDAFPAESHERALDLLTMMAQQLKDELGRIMQYPVGGDKWDARGNEIINVGTGGSGTSATNVDQVKYLIASEVGDDPSASASARSREALRRGYAEAGFNLVTGSFELGGTVTTDTDVLLYEAEGKAYSWGGTLSKDVSEGSTPSSSGGINAGAWADRSAAPNAFKQAGSGSVLRVAQDKMRERIAPQDKGAVGDGVTNDTAAFTALEADHPAGQEVDMLGKTYYVDAPFYGHRYYNGLWAGPFGTSRPRWQGAQMTGAGRIVFGGGALASLPENYSMGESATVVAMGHGAMGKMTQVKKAISIGTNSQAEGSISRDNISIGEDALRFVQSRTPDYDQAQQQGTRNIAIGGNAGRFIYEGIRDIAIGRNAGQCLVNSVQSTIVGSNAAGGFAPIGLSGVIENWAPNNGPEGVTAFGAEALGRTITGFNAAVGERAAESLVAGRGNVVMGPLALSNAEIDSGFNGKQLTNLNIDGTYSHSGNTLTLTFAGHGVSVGFTVGIRLLDGGSKTFQGDIAPAVVVSVIDANTFTVYHPTSRTASGTATLYWRTNLTDAPKAELNCVYGALAANSLRAGSENAVYGYRAMFDANSVASPSRNAAYGFMALTGWTDPQKMTAVGHYALRFKQDGSIATGSGLNCTGLGQNTRISGDNQVQIGDASTTTYVYGTVQNRSDERDKADIVDTSLGIEFIMGLRAVDGRWDMRDDYFEEYEQQVGIDENAQPVFETRLRKIPKDGSKKRTRKHHWFIAQEVKELCDNLGVEFGGYQDHSINEGCDVLSLGYDEFIPPLTKAVQDCWNEIESIKARLDAAGL